MTTSASAPTLLDHVYEELDLVNGTLLDAASGPDTDAAKENWHNLGDWLLLAARVDADRLFFVNDDPVLVFVSLSEDSAEDDILETYRRTWSLGRPRSLFLLYGHQLRVYSLATPPPAPDEPDPTLDPLEIITSASEIHELLADFHRDRLELGPHSGNRIFAEEDGRADHQLILDVHTATTQLVAEGLPHQIAHALIERAILVRYLEDRDIVTPEYFDDIAPPDSSIIEESLLPPAPTNFGPNSSFITLLTDRDRTYALFDKLAADFNGDLFIADPAEQSVVKDNHLLLLMDMLLGRQREGQQQLFLWAYDFKAVPTSLISTMYELFYHHGSGGSHADTHYTPSALVEFVLGTVLTADVLDRGPRICDPACGSGIFLVEAYRRIVRHETLRTGAMPTPERLKELLLSRVAGCDTNHSAIQLAAFSLYVAYLNYQSPADIRRAVPLPKLIRHGEETLTPAPLVVGDAFWPLQGETSSSNGSTTRPGDRLSWQPNSFDVIVGNPPWTEYNGEKALGEYWADRQSYAIGQRSPSQLFLWRAMHLLSADGVAALLVGANTMVNAQRSKEFRRQWLKRVSVRHIVNFSQVRTKVFNNAVAPFLLVTFAHKEPASSRYVIYENARRIRQDEPSAPALARLERQIVSQDSLQAKDYLWKTYTAGSIRDEALMTRLSLEDRLEEWAGSLQAWGYQRARGEDGNTPSEALRELPSLSSFVSWGAIDDDCFEEVPSAVRWEPDKGLLSGRRLLIRQGITPRFGPHARIEAASFGFRHTTYAISMEHLPVWRSAVILGTLLSQLGRYWLYMVSGRWGLWKDTLRKNDLLNLPLRFTDEADHRTVRLVGATQKLQHISLDKETRSWTKPVIPNEVKPVMSEIDDSIAEIFELSDAERDLVADFWLSQEENATGPVAWPTVERGTISEAQELELGGMGHYLQVFLKIWNSRLGGSGEFSWNIWHDREANIIAAVFQIQEVGRQTASLAQLGAREAWKSALSRLGVHWETTKSRSILRYGLVRAVSPTGIVIVKRNERRLWTASAARLDADATAAQAMSLESQ